MKFHVLEKLTYLKMQGTVDWWHVEMFHGRETLPFRNADPRVLPPPRPLSLRKNIYRMPDVFQPATADQLIISERTKTALADLPNLCFLRVRFAEAFEYPFEPADRSHWERWPKSTDQIDFLERMPVRDRTGDLPPYYELVVPRTEDVADRYPDTHPFEIQVEPWPHSERPIAWLSPELLREYPITWECSWVLSEAAFDRLSPFVDFRYFWHQPYLGGGALS